MNHQEHVTPPEIAAVPSVPPAQAMPQFDWPQEHAPPQPMPTALPQTPNAVSVQNAGAAAFLPPRDAPSQMYGVQSQQGAMPQPYERAQYDVQPQPAGLPPQAGMPPQYGPNWQEHAPPPAYYEVMQPQAVTARQQLEVIADKVGMVPNIRKKDNLMQGAVVGVCLLLGIGIGLLFEVSTMYALLGALGGLFVGAMVSGFVLMIAGLKRKT